jgi:hypothetical protein
MGDFVQGPMLILQDMHSEWRAQSADDAVSELLFVPELDLICGRFQCCHIGVN